MFKYNFHDLKDSPAALPEDVNAEMEAEAKKRNVPGLLEAMVGYRQKKLYGEMTVYGITPDQGPVPVFGCCFQKGVISQYQPMHVLGAPLTFTAYRILFMQNIKSSTVYMKKPREQPLKNSTQQEE